MNHFIPPVPPPATRCSGNLCTLKCAEPRYSLYGWGNLKPGWRRTHKSLMPRAIGNQTISGLTAILPCLMAGKYGVFGSAHEYGRDAHHEAAHQPALTFRQEATLAFLKATQVGGAQEGVHCRVLKRSRSGFPEGSRDRGRVFLFFFSFSPFLRPSFSADTSPRLRHSTQNITDYKPTFTTPVIWSLSRSIWIHDSTVCVCVCVCVILYFYPAACGPKGHGSGGSCFYSSIHKVLGHLITLTHGLALIKRSY